MSRIAPLAAFGRTDIATAGGKGANLGELVSAGFPVPDGFIITTAAYDHYVAATGIADRLAAAPDGAAARALFEPPMPAGLAEEISAAHRALGEGPVAVRSSATAEDLAEASFAGQQDTYLNISGEAALLDAVRRCWASLWTDRAVAYRSRAGVDGDVRLAVVVQRLVDAEAAGIMFTANPGNGRRDETVLNAAFGLGEAVVGGEVTPDEFVVAADAVTSRTTGDKRVHTVREAQGTATRELPEADRGRRVLTDAQAVALARLGRRIEAHFGAPQDIEWVLADGAFQIVQSRPVTALPEPVGPPPTQWPLPRTDGMFMRASIVEQLPDPLSPLFADLIRPAVASSLRTVLGRYFTKELLRVGDMDFPTINGYGYYFYSTAGMKRMLTSSPAALKVAFSPSSELNGVILWREHGLPEYRAVVDRWAARDEGELAASALLDGAAELIAAGAGYYTYVQAVIPQAAAAEIGFTKLYETLVHGKGRPAALTFLLGEESTPIRAERSLHAFARWCRATPGVADALAAEEPIPEEHRAAFEQKLAEHLARYGHLTYNLDVMQPVAADDPAPVLAALRFAASGDAVDPDERLARQASERATAQAWLDAHVDPVRRSVLARALTKARELGPLREDALADVGLGWPAARRLLRELGRRFADAGLLADGGDAFWLTEDEARLAASGLDAGRPIGPAADAAVAARKATWRGNRQVSPPGWLPAKGPFYQLFKRFMPSNEDVQTGPTLKGLGASGAVRPARRGCCAGRRTSRRCSRETCWWRPSRRRPTPRSSRWRRPSSPTWAARCPTAPSWRASTASPRCSGPARRRPGSPTAT
nr:PEP/pyruvate-binding domain-containing protein [Propioniciclava coleopterorum]